jgi:subtilisin family serine protease
VAGIIAAKADNGVGMVGIAPGARLLALRACSERQRGSVTASTCDSLTLAKALHFALERGADVINMSLSGPADPLLASLIELGLQRNVAVVAAFDGNRALAVAFRPRSRGDLGGRRIFAFGSAAGLSCPRPGRSDHATGREMVPR